MQTGRSTYFADTNYIIYTLLVTCIISLTNIFRNPLSGILIDNSFVDVTWRGQLPIKNVINESHKL